MLAKSPEANLFTGALGTSIPIELPRGRKNMTPQLALQYSSGGGPGPFGYGWDLPIGRIERSTKHGVPRCADHPDDHPDDFVLMMPGVTAELVRDPPGSSSNRYRPKIEQSYLEVTKQSDNTFTAIDRGGTKYTFGGIHARTGSTFPLEFMELGADGFCNFTSTWALTKVEDPNGNSISIAWLHFGQRNVLYPTSIRYGGNTAAGINHPYQILFDYQAVHVEDRVKSYRNGAPSELIFRLSQLSVFFTPPSPPNAQAIFVRGYTPTYNDQDPSYTHDDGPRLMLVAVDKTGYPTQHFAYSPWVDEHENDAGTAGSFVAPPVAGENFFRRSNVSNDVEQSIMDMNGDGFLDLLKSNVPVNVEKEWWVNEGYMDVGDPSDPTDDEFAFRSATTIWVLPQAWFDDPCSPQLATACQEGLLRRVDNDGNLRHTRRDTFDITGDGVPDNIDVTGWMQNTAERWVVWPGILRDDGLELGKRWGFADQPILWHAPRKYIRGDFTGDQDTDPYIFQDTIDINGDGRPDLIYTNPGSPAPHSWDVYLNNGDGFESAPQPRFPAPIDALGRDYVDVLDETYGHTVMLTDFNGDGLADLLAVGDSAAGVDSRCMPSSTERAQCIEVYFNTGQGFTALPQLQAIPPRQFLQGTVRLGDNVQRVFQDLIDINGDGLVDFIEDGGTSYGVLLNLGGRFEPVTFGPSHCSPGFTCAQTARDWALGGDIRRTDNRRSVIEMLDVNGDGMMDRIDATTVPWRVHLNRAETSTKPNLLSVMENGVGGTNTVAYAPSTRYDNTGGDPKTDLPFVTWVVAGLRQSDGCDPGGSILEPLLRGPYSQGLGSGSTTLRMGFFSHQARIQHFTHRLTSKHSTRR